MEPQFSGDSIQTLRFGEQCSSVLNQAKAGASSIETILAGLDTEIASVTELIKKKERWEDVRVIQRDAFDGDIVTTKSALVGAEKERERLERLLARRRTLLGIAHPDEKEAKQEPEQTVSEAKEASLPATSDVFTSPTDDTVNHSSSISSMEQKEVQVVAEERQAVAEEKKSVAQLLAPPAKFRKGTLTVEERRIAAAAKAAERAEQAKQRRLERAAKQTAYASKVTENVMRAQARRKLQIDQQAKKHAKAALRQQQAKERRAAKQAANPEHSAQEMKLNMAVDAAVAAELGIKYANENTPASINQSMEVTPRDQALSTKLSDKVSTNVNTNNETTTAVLPDQSLNEQLDEFSNALN
jgi:hypothetical protein